VHAREACEGHSNDIRRKLLAIRLLGGQVLIGLIGMWLFALWPVWHARFLDSPHGGGPPGGQQRLGTLIRDHAIIARNTIRAKVFISVL
jgi:hypothetical protein